MALEHELFVDHIKEDFDKMLANFREGDKVDESLVMSARTVKEKRSVFSLPQPMPKPTKNMGTFEEVNPKQKAIDFALNLITQEVKWDRDEEDFNMAKMSLTEQATGAADHFVQVPWYMIAEYLEGTAGSAGDDYYDNIPNAWDGNHLVSDAGGTRFGVLGGNVIASGSGVEKVDSIVTDTWAGVKRATSFKLPRNSNQAFKFRNNTKMLALIPGELTSIFEETATSKFFIKTLSTGETGTEEGNLYVGGAKDLSSAMQAPRFSYRVLDGLSDSDNWYLILHNPTDPNTKPFMRLNHANYDPYIMTPFTDRQQYALAKDRKLSVLFETQTSVIPFNPYCIIKITNS